MTEDRRARRPRPRPTARSAPSVDQLSRETFPGASGPPEELPGSGGQSRDLLAGSSHRHGASFAGSNGDPFDGPGRHAGDLFPAPGPRPDAFLGTPSQQPEPRNGPGTPHARRAVDPLDPAFDPFAGAGSTGRHAAPAPEDAGTGTGRHAVPESSASAATGTGRHAIPGAGNERGWFDESPSPAAGPVRPVVPPEGPRRRRRRAEDDEGAPPPAAPPTSQPPSAALPATPPPPQPGGRTAHGGGAALRRVRSELAPPVAPGLNSLPGVPTRPEPPASPAVTGPGGPPSSPATGPAWPAPQGDPLGSGRPPRDPLTGSGPQPPDLLAGPGRGDPGAGPTRFHPNPLAGARPPHRDPLSGTGPQQADRLAAPGRRHHPPAPPPAGDETVVLPRVPAPQGPDAQLTQVLPPVPRRARTPGPEPVAEVDDDLDDEDEISDDARAQERPEPKKRDPVHIALRTFGELMLTAGLVVLLFVVYEVYVTDWISAGKQNDVTQALDQRWRDGQDPLERGEHFNLATGEGFAKMYIPKFGPDFAFTVLEGTDDKTIEAGPGHYKDTALPGQPGNFAVAGHRVGKGAPFNDLDVLESCDAVVVETASSWYVYRVLPMRSEADGWFKDNTSKGNQARCDKVTPLRTSAPGGGPYAKTFGQQIVTPDRSDVIAPVPNNPNARLPKDQQLKLLTLTTCHPKFSARERLIIHAVLVKEMKKSDIEPGKLPDELKEG
ncbi:hypothetical protein GCM10012275_55900 [Longimycelium tulufanense]|uniref:LPXTG-site transpeptidase (Sortase) family protein n=1 Tax=Longimycelium tulufanense TaxID=907463 RepID=A0A8J3CJQ4_9PSEU|nr:class E sortase [Longimycelium tulufanense]GGM78072.1 hypothetical protein GCM10012275_55900 [Longimycelium tulufanense]